MPLETSIPRHIVIEDGGDNFLQGEEKPRRKKHLKKSSKEKESSRSSRRKSKSEKKEKERKHRKEKKESSGGKRSSRRHKSKSKSRSRALSGESDSIEEEADFLLDTLLESDGENLKQTAPSNARGNDSDSEQLEQGDRYKRLVHSSDQEEDSMVPVRHGIIVANEKGTNPFEDVVEDSEPIPITTAKPSDVERNTNPFDGDSSEEELDEESDEDLDSLPPPIAEKDVVVESPSGHAGKAEGSNSVDDTKVDGPKDVEESIDDADGEEKVKEKTTGEKALDNIATSLGSMFTLGHKRSKSDDNSNKSPKASSLLKPKVPFLGKLMGSKSDAGGKNVDEQANGVSLMQDWSNPFAVDNNDATSNNVEEKDAQLVKTSSTDEGVEASIVGSNVDEKELEDVSLNTGDQQQGIKRVPTDSTRNESSEGSERGPEDDDEDGDDDEEDVVESSKRLLRMADQRLQYQKSADEIKKLKTQLVEMQDQAAALTEQLRRAIETKCDLVLAQTEMERFHEHSMLCKDDEIKDLHDFNNDLMEKTSNLETKLMLEVGGLTQRLNDMDRKHRNEMLEKDYEIAQLEQRLSKMKSESVRSGESRSAYKSRFMEFGVGDNNKPNLECPPSVECA